VSEPQRRPMTPEEFFAWQAKQDRNNELVEGFPVLPLKATRGATLRDDRVTVTALVSFGNQLRGGPCRPTTDDAAVRMPRGNIRPDLAVDCGQIVDAALEAQEPRLVLEVLSPSTMNIDRFRKLEEYKSHPAIRLVLLVETRGRKVGLWRRDDQVGRSKNMTDWVRRSNSRRSKPSCRSPTSTKDCASTPNRNDHPLGCRLRKDAAALRIRPAKRLHKGLGRVRT
jgi:Uma2 family endonuclease